MHRCSLGLAALMLIAAPLGAPPAHAQIVVSANDNKVANVDGRTTVIENPPPDTVDVINLNVFPPRIIATLKAPASVVGPPTSVAVAPDESFALVTGGFRIDPTNPKAAIPDDKLTVIDLKASPPMVVATLQSGFGASGVSINRAGTLALVCNRSEGTVSVFKIAGKTLTRTAVIQLGDTKSQPSHAVFTPDGKTALVTRDGDHRISILSVDGDKVEDTKRYMVAGIRPYAITVSPKGTVAVLTNQGGGQGDSDIISVIDLRQHPPRVVDNINVGQTPEGAAMSPDGNYVAITIQNGSARVRGSPAYNDHGLLKVFRINGANLTLAAEAKVGGWGQGVVWSRNGRTLLAQSMHNKALDILSFNGSRLKVTGHLKVSGNPAGIRTAEH